MIGTHVVTLIPDPATQSFGAVLPDNYGFWTDLYGWTQMPFSPPWTWAAGKATNTAEGAALTRDPNGPPVYRGATTQAYMHAQIHVDIACQITVGFYLGDSPTAAAFGPFWAGAEHAVLWERQFNAPAAGDYLVSTQWDYSAIDPRFTFLAPHTVCNVAGSNPKIDEMPMQLYGPAVTDLSCLVESVTVRHGRDSTDAQPEASSATVSLSADTGVETFPAGLDIGGVVRVTTNVGGTSSLRFVGKVTDVTQSWEDAGEDTPDRVTAEIIAVGALADLGRRVVGATPWTQELDGSRVSRVMAAAGVTLNPATSDPGTVQILPRDVDSQPALDVAQGTALSAGGVVWSTRGGEIRYADANHRHGTVSALELDACEILVAPEWKRTTDGLINDVSIGYGVAPEGGEQPRYLAANAASKTKYGWSGYTTTTELAAAADATAFGDMLLRRNAYPVWIMGVLPVDVAGLDDAETAALLGLDMHSLISLTGLPASGSAPTSAFLWVEGWSETLEYGVHEFGLVVSGYCRTTPVPTWDAVNVPWDKAPASSTWDMGCVGPVPPAGRWDDVPASTRWDSLALITWNEWT